MKEKLTSTLLSVLLFGCATSAKYQIGSSDLSLENGFDLLDNRSEKDKQSEIMSVNKSNCWFGIYRIGDDQIEPFKLNILASLLENKLDSKIKGSKVIVKRFEMFNNIQLSMRNVVSAYTFGLGRTVPTSEEIVSGGCADAFDLDTNPKNVASVIILYDLNFDGKEISGKTVQLDPEGARNENVRSPTVNERIQKGISRAAEEISDKYLK